MNWWSGSFLERCYSELTAATNKSSPSIASGYRDSRTYLKSDISIFDQRTMPNDANTWSYAPKLKSVLE